MDTLEKILEDMNTEEYHEKLKKWSIEYAKEYKATEEIKRRKKEKLLANTDYINWLINFTIKNNGSFADDTWLYNPEELKKNDSEKINDLQLFYEGINDYAKSINIDPLPTKFGNEYKIKFNDTGLKIGIDMGQGAYFYCQKINIDNENEFINFLDINKNRNKTKALKNND